MNELATLLADAKSIIEQIQQLETGEAAGTPAAAVQQADVVPTEEPGGMTPDGTPPPKEPEDPNDPKKLQARKDQGTPDAGTTASDDADTRLLDDQTDLDEKTKEIVKNLIGKGVIKLVAKSDFQKEITIAVKALNAAVRKLAGVAQDHDTALGFIIKGMGYGDAITKTYTSEVARQVNKSSDPRPVMTAEKESLESIKKSIEDLSRGLARKEQRTDTVFDRGEEVRKDLGSIMHGLLSNRV